MTEQMKKERARRLFLIAFVLFTLRTDLAAVLSRTILRACIRWTRCRRGSFGDPEGAAGSCGSVCDRGTVGMWESDVGDDQLLPVRGGNVCPWYFYLRDIS